MNSKTYACLNQSDLAVAWLETALLFGTNYKEQIKEELSDKAFDSLRTDEAFKQHEKK